jgi:putative DNA primase/helicase
VAVRQQTLDEIFEGNAGMIAFIQRAAGYCLTGLVSEETLLFLYGPGGNGKGTVIETLLWVMGRLWRYGTDK